LNDRRDRVDGPLAALTKEKTFKMLWKEDEEVL